MEKKYELLSDDTKILPNGTKLYRIRALISFGNVNAGDLGGYIEKEGNLSHDGDAWVFGNAEVYGNAEVCGDAEVESLGDLCTFGYFGSANRTTTAFKTQDGGIGVVCGCFHGTLDEFRAKVRDTHGINDYAVEYLMIADLMEHKLLKRKA